MDVMIGWQAFVKRFDDALRACPDNVRTTPMRPGQLARLIDHALAVDVRYHRHEYAHLAAFEEPFSIPWHALARR